MKKRSSTSLRQKGSIAEGVDSSKGQDGDVPISKTKAYQREKKRRQRARKNGGEQKKRGPKEKIGIKNMTLEERREYERKVKR